MKEDEFLDFLGSILMAENPLSMDEKIPEDIYDSTGKLIITVAFARDFNIPLTADSFLNRSTPRDLYELLQ